MKFCKRSCLKILNLFLFSLLLVSCLSSANGQFELPADYQGTWADDQAIITVRSWKFPFTFNFFPDTAIVRIRIDENHTASGTIGKASFKDAPIRLNSGNPDKTGVVYIIECGEIGRIFESDPLEKKEVELWISPLKKSGTLEAELRYTSRMSQFPMAGLVFKKVNP